jgi:hypothetical protein
MHRSPEILALKAAKINKITPVTYIPDVRFHRACLALLSGLWDLKARN